MKRLVGITLSVTGLLGGCGTHPFLGSPGSPDGVAMKAEYRGILSATRWVPDEQGNAREVKVTCPEARPDAISARSLAAAFSEALDAKAGDVSTEKQLGAALSVGQSVASIGLRTQSIQLMLDGLVYNCILFMNGAITREDAYLLQRRAQTFTLGLLAIEQLTGPVKAQQAALTTEGGAGQGKSDVSAEATRLEAAESSLGNTQQAHAQAKSRLETLTTNRAEQEAETKKAKDAYDAAVKKASGKAEDSEEKKTEAKKLQEFKDADAELKKRDEALRNQEGEVKRLALAEKSAERQVKIAEDALQLAQSRQRAYTNAAMAFGASGGGSVTITDKIADSVVDIVQLVLVESGAGETCAAMASDFRRKATSAAEKNRLVEGMKAVCPDLYEKFKDSRDPVVVKNLEQVKEYRSTNRLPQLQ